MIKRKNSRSRIASEHPLKDKVALLIDGASSGGLSLAKSLAEHGADIAIVYRRAHAGQVRQMKHSVEAAGQRCLIIQSQTNDETFAKEVIRKTLKRLGRLDIFIDYSSLSEGLGEIDDVIVAQQGDSIDEPDPFKNDEIIASDIQLNDQKVKPSKSEKET